MKQQLLLLEDVDDLGKSGDLVTVKSGYSRNFLLPQKKAIIVDKNTLKRQEKLQEERKKKALIDQKESEEIAAKLKNITLSVEVKTDPEGRMYGSVSAADVADLLNKEGFEINKKSVKLVKPLKEIGMHAVPVLLKEGIETKVAVNVKQEGVIEAVVDEVVVNPVEAVNDIAEEDLEPTKEELTHKEKKEVNDASKKI